MSLLSSERLNDKRGEGGLKHGGEIVVLLGILQRPKQRGWPEPLRCILTCNLLLEHGSRGKSFKMCLRIETAGKGNTNYQESCSLKMMQKQNIVDKVA